MFNIWKSANVIYNMIITVGAEEPLDKLQQFFMMNNEQQTKNRREVSQTEKGH